MMYSKFSGCYLNLYILFFSSIFKILYGKKCFFLILKYILMEETQTHEVSLTFVGEFGSWPLEVTLDDK